jgi:4-amino-4-deoxy-L-arabinose transferase-like glycosyltransferase
MMTTFQIRNPVEAFRRRRLGEPYGRWEVIALLAVLAMSAGLNVWNLSANGWANAYYSAAVQSGLHNREALIFGASDWGNSISVDKPPLSLWLIGLSVRLFGLNSWSLLLPQALLGVATAALIFFIVRRRASGASALIAAAVYATTPIAVLLSRYNNPDPLLIFLMMLALEAALRGIESHRVGWFLIAGLLLGLGFMTKQLQVALIAPALTLAVLAAFRLDWRKHLTAAGAAITSFAAVAGGWLAFVDLTPAANRPYVGSSPTNSLTDLTVGYNGVNRIIDTDDAVVNLMPRQYVGTGQDAGFLRLLNGNYNQEATWLLPLGLISAVFIVWTLRRTRTTSLAIASATWLVTAYLLLSFMGNDIHTYYTMNLAPPLALTVGLGVHAFRINPRAKSSRWTLSLGVGLSGILSWLILESLDAGDLLSLFGWAALVLGLLASILIAFPLPTVWDSRVTAALAVAGLLLGPLATDLATIGHGQTGSNPVSGSLTKNPNSISHFLAGLSAGDPKWASDISHGAKPLPGLLSQLETRNDCRWPAATYPAQTAANWQLASNRAIMPVGGFSASDPSPTLYSFQKLVANGAVCYFLDYPELDAVTMNQSASGQIIGWVRSNFSHEVIDGVAVYRLTQIQ